MPVRSAWASIETNYDNRISFIEDIANHTGGTTITNDAENVLNYFRDNFGAFWRVVYKDTENEWWEIVSHVHPWTGNTEISFERWHGLAWDILKRQV